MQLLSQFFLQQLHGMPVGFLDTLHIRVDSSIESLFIELVHEICIQKCFGLGDLNSIQTGIECTFIVHFLYINVSSQRVQGMLRFVITGCLSRVPL